METIFENDARQIRSYLDSLWTDTVSVDIRNDSPNHLDTTAFLNLWSRGAGMVSYMGHANEVQFSYSRYFTTWSIDSLKNGNQLPGCLLGGCDLVYETGPDLPISTHLMQHSGGGAVAVISSEGLNYEITTLTFFESMIKKMITHPGDHLGKSYQEAMSDYSDYKGLYGIDLYQRFTLLGDPALSVKHSPIQTFIVSNPVRPSSFVLNQNYPNPFNPSTVISYQLPMNSAVTLRVYDMLGREIKSLVNERQAEGIHSVTFNAGSLASGVYLYRLEAGTYIATKKLILLK